MGCVVLVLRSLRSCWSCSVAGIFRLAECEAGSVVGSLCGWFCVGTLPVEICAVGVIGSKVVSGEYVKRVHTHLSVQLPLLEGSCYVRYGSTCSGIFLIGRAYVNAVLSWRECTAGLTVRLMRSYVRV